MADEVDNLTIRLLQEMRAEMGALRSEMNNRFDAIDERFDAVDERFDAIDIRVDGNTLILNMLAGLVSSHEDRLETLEEARR